jgi:hypothetical protein
MCVVGSGLAMGWSPVRGVLPVSCLFIVFTVMVKCGQARGCNPSKEDVDVFDIIRKK